MKQRIINLYNMPMMYYMNKCMPIVIANTVPRFGRYHRVCLPSSDELEPCVQPATKNYCVFKGNQQTDQDIQNLYNWYRNLNGRNN